MPNKKVKRKSSRVAGPPSKQSAKKVTARKKAAKRKTAKKK